MKKTIAMLICALMLMSMVAGCAAPAEPVESAPAVDNTQVAEATEEEIEAGEKYSEDIRIGSEEDLPNADPYGDTQSSNQMFTNLTFNTLIKNEVGNPEVVPELATSWDDVNGDGTVWDVHLAEGVTFHDGSAFTAADVVFTWNYIIDANNVVKVFTGPCVDACTSVDALDDYTVRFTLSQPMPDFISYLELKIYSKTAFDTLGAEKACVIGSGPYYFNEEMTKDAIQFVATRYDNYWQGLSKYPTKNLIFVVLASSDTMTAALQTGEVDVIFSVLANQVPNLEGDSNVTIYTTEGAFSYYMGLNYNNNDDFQDAGFRTALSQGIDRDAITAIAFENMGSASYNIVSPIAKGYSADVKCAGYDPEAAKAYFEANGYAGKTYVISYPTQTCKLIAEVIQANLSDLGLNIELKQVDVTNWTAHKASDEYDMFLDAIGMQGALLHNVNRLLYTDGSSNGYGHNNPEYNAAQDKVSAQTTWDGMINEFKALQEFEAVELGVVPLNYDTFIYAVNKNVGGLFLANSKNFCNFSTLYKLAD